MKELIFILGMLLLPAMCFADDNIITMEQTGDNFELTIDQIGYNNVIQRWRTNDTGIFGANNKVTIRQQHNKGGSSDQNVIEIRQVVGAGNNLALGQGYHVSPSGSFSIDNDEYGDTFAHINVTGDNNNIAMAQRTNSNSSGHEYWLHVEGDDNDIHTVQREGGSQFINLDIFNDSNEVSLIQKNSGDHYMSVVLGGSDPTAISVMQSGSNNNSYSITNYCYTPGGCNVSVLQQ
jgi:hypothetical protein